MDLISQVDEVADTIKNISWRWFLARKKGDSCLYYEWFYKRF